MWDMDMWCVVDVDAVAIALDDEEKVRGEGEVDD